MRVNTIIEITVIMCTCIDVLVQYVHGLYITITLSYKYLNGVLQYHCNTVMIATSHFSMVSLMVKQCSY